MFISAMSCDPFVQPHTESITLQYNTYADIQCTSGYQGGGTLQCILTDDNVLKNVQINYKECLRNSSYYLHTTSFRRIISPQRIQR